MNHVIQTNRFNCGSACLAMVLDSTVERIEALYNRHPGKGYNGKYFGWDGDEIARAFFDAGFLHMHGEFREFRASKILEFVKTRKTLSELFVEMREDSRKCLITTLGGNHWIVMEKESIHDPAQEKPENWSSFIDRNREPIGTEYILVIKGLCNN